MAEAPNKLYYVKVLPGGTPLKFRQRGGGVYVDEKYANSQFKSLRAHGSIVELMVAEVEWTVVESSE